jgi:hypothetical protein
LVLGVSSYRANAISLLIIWKRGYSTINKNMQNLYRKYREYILFNKSIFIAGMCAFLAAAYVSQASYLTYNKSNITNSIVALTTEYGVYLPIFALLFYLDNRYRYVDLTGTRNHKVIILDIKKLIASFSVSEIVYSVTKISSNYQLLQLGIQPYQASMVSSLIASLVFYVVINVIVIKVVKLFSR